MYLHLNVFIMELTDRELALRWWNRKSIQERARLVKQAKFSIEGSHLTTLSSSEIEWIWRNQPYNS
jgi:hypothetical protein